jgi:tetratricopeptide (TPR) repeat protein
MMKKILPLLFTLFSVSAAVAQPYNAMGFYKTGIDQKNKNMILEAMVSFKKAISLDKKFDSAYLELGGIYARTPRTDSAVWYFNKAISINPSMVPALLALGNFYRDVKPNYDSALICYQAALKKDSLNKVIYYSIAWCYNAKTEYEKAIPPAVKALNIDNEYKPAYSELGHAYRRTGKYKECIEQLKKNLAVSVVDVALLYTGFCYVELKDKESAMQQYEELKKINEKMAASLKRQIDAMK